MSAEQRSQETYVDLITVSKDGEPDQRVIDPDMRDRAVAALCRFVFPDCFVPRHEMATAVLQAITQGDDWMDYLPAKRVIRPEGP